MSETKSDVSDAQKIADLEHKVNCLEKAINELLKQIAPKYTRSSFYYDEDYDVLKSEGDVFLNDNFSENIKNIVEPLIDQAIENLGNRISNRW